MTPRRDIFDCFSSARPGSPLLISPPRVITCGAFRLWQKKKTKVLPFRFYMATMPRKLSQWAAQKQRERDLRWLATRDSHQLPDEWLYRPHYCAHKSCVQLYTSCAFLSLFIYYIYIYVHHEYNLYILHKMRHFLFCRDGAIANHVDVARWYHLWWGYRADGAWICFVYFSFIYIGSRLR